MTATYPNPAGAANFAGARSCSTLGKVLPSISSVMRVARALWPTKAEMELRSRTGRSERMCRYWLAERCGMRDEDMASLLRSEEGLHFLEAVMGDARPLWWAAFRRQSEISELRRLQALQQKRLEELERAAGQ